VQVSTSISPKKYLDCIVLCPCRDALQMGGYVFRNDVEVKAFKH